MKLINEWLTKLGESISALEKQKITRYFFILSLIVFTLSQTYLTAAPHLSRQLPVEVDDAYGYILKAEEIRAGCFFQDCPALVDLREQFTSKSQDLSIAYHQAREYHRVFVVYHPLHSILLLALRALGISYEAGYAILAIAFKILLCLALAYWLKGLFGYGPSAVTLLFLAPAVFTGQGIHTIVPSNMALALAFILWGMIANRHPKTLAALIPIVIALLLLHQVGRIYAAIGIFLLVTTFTKPLSRLVKWIAAISAFLVLLSFILPAMIQYPELNFNPIDFYPGTWFYSVELLTDLPWLLTNILLWVAAFGPSWLAAGLLSFGLLLLAYRKNRDWALHGAALIAFLIFSIFYVVPWFGALTFERAWVPFAIFLTAIVGYGFWLMLASIILWIMKVWQSRLETSSQLGLLVKKNALPLLLITLFAYFSINMIQDYSAAYGRLYDLTLHSSSRGAEFILDSTQPYLAYGPSNSNVLFLDEWPLYYYLINGGLNNHAFYYPTIGAFSSLAQLQRDINPIDFVVRINPIYQFTYLEGNGITLPAGGRLEFKTLHSPSIRSFNILLSNVARDTQLRIDWQTGDEIVHTRFTIPADNSEWLEISQDEINAEIVTIRVFSNESLVVNGLKLSADSVTNWPWNSSVELLVKSPDRNAESLLFSPDALFTDLPLELEVIADSGVTILARVIH
jgi:hypothetical protein